MRWTSGSRLGDLWCRLPSPGTRHSPARAAGKSLKAQKVHTTQLWRPTGRICVALTFAWRTGLYAGRADDKSYETKRLEHLGARIDLHVHDTVVRIYDSYF